MPSAVMVCPIAIVPGEKLVLQIVADEGDVHVPVVLDLGDEVALLGFEVQ